MDALPRAQDLATSHALDALPEDRRRAAQTTLEIFCTELAGVSIGPQRLVRTLVDERLMGHRSALEAVLDLTRFGLIEARETGGHQVLWAPSAVLDEHANKPAGSTSRRGRSAPRRSPKGGVK